jgi:catechol 2,3-dioxygenase-like lactoylglutathione lyase family enzyme
MPRTSDGEELRGVDMKLEVVVVPVSDVERAKGFYETLGWRLDADFVTGDDFRVVQFTPPGWYAEYMGREQAGDELPQ